MIASLLLMALLVILNIVGLGVGKWINNIGGIGTGVAAAVLDRTGSDRVSRVLAPPSQRLIFAFPRIRALC